MDYIDTVLIGQAAARAMNAGDRSWKELATTLTETVKDLRAQLDAKDSELIAVKASLLRKSVECNARLTTMQAMMAEMKACPEMTHHHPLAHVEKRADGEERSGAAQIYTDAYDREFAEART